MPRTNSTTIPTGAVAIQYTPTGFMMIAREDHIISNHAVFYPHYSSILLFLGSFYEDNSFVA
jgi:hypothetical protein